MVKEAKKEVVTRYQQTEKELKKLLVVRRRSGGQLRRPGLNFLIMRRANVSWRLIRTTKSWITARCGEDSFALLGVWFYGLQRALHSSGVPLRWRGAFMDSKGVFTECGSWAGHLWWAMFLG
ncbi:UNVERIFIED_CONTAM: hypothetical protein Sangu_2230300 [Sesamum angustifolium]|uniref:Uncharacterized protein n=1 Tax=Sesamum angustifolium TaxID=2727405 RepID=A0AAW2L3K4_9LAMI